MNHQKEIKILQLGRGTVPKRKNKKENVFKADSAVTQQKFS